MRISVYLVSLAAALALMPSAVGQGFEAEDLVSETETWFQAPAISPDGTTIAFAAHGDIWTVSSAGGNAIAVTRDNGWDGMPVWSRDGARLAFASDRNGNLDVFVMNADGTGLQRLTYHDANDYPSDFAPDGSGVLFASSRGQSAGSSYFPTGALPQLYQVPVAGGTPRMVTTVPGMEARYSPDGTKIAYRDEKAYENEWRQRDVSSFARDVWIYDLQTGTHTMVTDTPGGDHAPAWSADGLSLFMQSEVDGDTFNLRRVDLSTGQSETLTQHGPHPARATSISADGTLVYTYHGTLHKIAPGGQSEALSITVPAGRIGGEDKPLMAAGNISEFDISPDGSEIAYVFRGEIFVTDTEFADTVRVTDTTGQERSVSFSPDGRTLIYAAEEEGGWGIYETGIAEENAPRFSLSVQFKTKQVYKPKTGNAFQPAYSPDGETIGFIENRDLIRVMDRNGADRKTIFNAEQNYSYSDGDISFHFSPDSKWIAADYTPRGYYFYTDIGLAPVDGSAPAQDISLNGYYDGAPVWHSSGDLVYWFTDRYGERTHGSWGSEGDIVAAFLTEASWTRFNLSEQERAALEDSGDGKSEDEDEDAKDEDEDEEEDDTPKADIAKLLNLVALREEDADIEIDFEAIKDRTIRLTPQSSDLADAVLGPDMKKLYYLAAFEGGYDLWVNDLVEGGASKVAALGADSASMSISDDGSMLVILADGGLRQAKLGDDVKVKPVETNAEMRLRTDAERLYIFNHTWHQVADKFYDPAYHGVDWDAMEAAYKPKVAAVSNNRDFAVLMSELLGQLNASHTGMRYRSGRNGSSDQTAALGVIFDLDGGNGLRIGEILDDGPLDRDALDVEMGDRITAIDGQSITGTQNAFELLNRKAGDRVRLTLGNKNTTITVRTYSRRDEGAALYDRWIERRRAIVEARSDGRIGFVHIRSMNDTGFRQIFSELFGRNFDKEAVIVDTRFNGGGWLHDDLVTLLDGESYFNLRARDRIVSGAPEERWTKPSAVVMNEGNYSNAHMFPYAYDLFDIGPTVGMPVPGTATAVWWEGQVSGDLVFGIPQLPVLDQQNQPLENQELQPDILVDNAPQFAEAGRDLPLETAVDALLTTLATE
ncbi:MAG: S41 family peptidase [Pseudomonadota bacterium]